MSKKKLPEVKPCPFCGFQVDANDRDTLYPSGPKWRDESIGRVYMNARSTEYDGECFQLICNTLYGGCGAEMNGDSIEEVLEKWGRRTLRIYNDYTV